MNIGAARTDLASLAAVQGARPTTVTVPNANVQSTPTESAPPATAASNVIDMDAFMAAWGSDDATWDIDGSGKVDGTDLGAILSAQAQASTGDNDLESLLGAWGTADSDWDLNGDGIVNGIDLGMHLNGETGGTSNSTAATLEGFAGAWGSSDPAYDINGDGIVDGADLGAFISQNAEAAANVDQNQLASLLDAWGTDNPEFDFNGDGIVDGADLGSFLAGETGGEEQAREIAPGNERLDEVANRLADAAFKALGGDGTGSVAASTGGMLSHLDADGDGQISRDDLITSIRQRLDQLVGSDGSVDDAQLRGFIGKWMERFGEGGLHADPVRQANHRHGVEQHKAKAIPLAGVGATNAAATKVERVLSSLGQEVLPPNLSNLLGKVALPGTNPDAVMMQLLAKHPIGGVETTA